MVSFSQIGMDSASHCLEGGGVVFSASPNWNERPVSAIVDMVVIHSISLPRGEYGTSYVADLFMDRLDYQAHPDFGVLQGKPVSAHLFIRRDGRVMQFVPFDKRAWHAGESSWQDVTGCNDFSIGIELEGTDDSPFEDVQYECLAAVIALLREHYPAITSERILGHSDVAPGRKKDPGSRFDWERLRGLTARA